MSARAADRELQQPILRPVAAVPAVPSRNLVVPEVVPRLAVETAETRQQSVLINGRVYNATPVDAPVPLTIGARGGTGGRDTLRPQNVDKKMSLFKAWQVTFYGTWVSAYATSLVCYYCTGNWCRTCGYCAEDSFAFCQGLCAPRKKEGNGNQGRR